MRLGVYDKNFHLRLILLLLCVCGDVLPKNPYKSGEVRADSPKGCAYLRCKRGDQCVNRKFWCRNPPCPSMLYCSKSRKESLKGPSSCEAVRCSKGFVCLVRVRHCRWNEPCEQQIARCVSERDYYDGPASCADFKCPSGLRCVLRESLCAKPPCKLVKSCANPKDVKAWHGGCKSLGCPSEHECFLRRPSRGCPAQSCKHTPDCSAGSEGELEANEQCRGWVCPMGEECSAHTRGPCKSDSCKVSRSCHKPLMVPLNVTAGPSHSWRDDMKLSFYSRRGENHPATDVFTNKFSQGDRRTSTVGNSANGGSRENPIRKATTHVSPNSRSSRPTSASPDIVSGRAVQPTVTSLSAWLDNLKLKTGVEAIEAWIKKAEKQQNYGAFLEWLETVKDMLGPTAYDLWLEEVRTMTVTRGAFQKWLPRPTSSTTVSPDFVEPSKNVGDVNHRRVEVSPESGKLAEYQITDDKTNFGQGLTNIAAQKTGSMIIDDHKKENYIFSTKNDTSVKPETKIVDYKDESYIFPPKNDTTYVQPEIIEKNPIATLSGISSLQPSPRTDEWRPVYNPGPIVQQIQPSYPLQQNFGNFLPWANQAQQFAGFDSVDPRNSWYQQFQQPPGVDLRFSNPNSWQSQMTSLMTPQRNQMSMNQRYLESSRTLDQPYQTNWSFQQPPNADFNYFYPNSWVDQPQRDENSIDRGFLESGKVAVQFPSDWSIQQPQDANGQFLQPNDRQGQFDQSSNPPKDQKFLLPDKYPEQQFQTNWPFSLPLNNDPNFLRPAMWRANGFPPANTEWQQNESPRDQSSRRTLETPKLSDEIPSRVNEEPPKYYSDNSTTVDTSWIKRFIDETLRLYAPQEIIGSFPKDGESVGYDSWPGTNYQGRSTADVPHRRTKHEDSKRDFGQFGHGDRDPGKPGQIARRMVEDSGLLAGFPWLRDQDRSLYEKNYWKLPPVSPGPMWTHRVDVDARSPGPNPLFDDGLRDAPRLQFHWANSYLQDRLYGVPRFGSSFLGPQRPAIGNPAYDGPPDPFPKVNQPEVIGDRKFGFVYRDREFDAPGQPMDLPDLWNAKFRSPLSAALQRADKEKSNWSYRDVVEKKCLISTTTSPPVVPTLETVAPHLVMAITSKLSQVENNNYQEGTKGEENYDDEGIYPLLLSLQGYIETSKEDELENPAVSSKNSTILPVYKVEDDADDVDYSNEYDSPTDDAANFPTAFEDEPINLFKNVNYGGTPDFPDNLKNVFDVEAALIMENTTGDSDVVIKDVRWVYDDDEEDTSGPSNFFVQSQDSGTSSRESSDIQEPRDWPGSSVESRNEDAKNDYYDVGLDYDDKINPGDRINRNFQPVNTDDPINREEAPDDLVDSFNNDPDHKRFKKNRP